MIVLYSEEEVLQRVVLMRAELDAWRARFPGYCYRNGRIEIQEVKL